MSPLSVLLSSLMTRSFSATLAVVPLKLVPEAEAGERFRIRRFRRRLTEAGEQRAQVEWRYIEAAGEGRLAHDLLRVDVGFDVEAQAGHRQPIESSSFPCPGSRARNQPSL